MSKETQEDLIERLAQRIARDAAERDTGTPWSDATFRRYWRDALPDEERDAFRSYATSAQNFFAEQATP